MPNEIQFDALPPAKMASRMEEVGVKKAELNIWTMFALAVLAGEIGRASCRERV